MNAWRARPDCISMGQSIAATTYYGIGGHAEYFAQPRSLSELRACLAWGKKQKLPMAVLGSGSNSLFADGAFAGLVITLSHMTNAYWETDDCLYVEAGVSNTEIAEICLDAGRAGAAWMYRMPGQLGATVRMNARCYGGEISQIASEVFTLDVNGFLRIHRGQDVFHGYKKTLLMDSPEIVVAARLRLPNVCERAEILEIMMTCEADRHRKHHFEHPSCGSTFKNNYQVGRPSGQVFDECGLKGTRIGRSEVSQYHANFVWNLGGASARDMLQLAAHMRERALTLRQADLELEVQPMGLFDDSVFSACALDRLGPSVIENNAHWVGLLWHPSEHSQSDRSHSFPHTLMHAPFQHYVRMPGNGMPELQVRLTQLMSLADANRYPTQPFVRWETLRPQASSDTDSNWRALFPLSAPGEPDFTDELWHFSVSELFIAHGDAASTHYLEFEMTPDGHWIALAFDAPRQRSAQHQSPQKHLWKGLSTHTHGNRFWMEFSFDVLKNLIHDQQLRVQACLSLGGQGLYLAPHWAPSGSLECWDSQDKPVVKPDFHQPQRFWRVALK